MIKIFNTRQKELASKILDNKLSKLDDLNSSEIKELAIAWCYYSAKIEGNTYTYVETEALLKDNITSEKRYEDAKMLKNLYNTFIGEIKYIYKDKNVEEIDITTLLRIHRSLSSELISTEEQGEFRNRAVRISGTEYTPPADIIEIKMQINEILYNQQTIENPLERAIYLHCNIARLQPFIDVNKRTSRMVESIVLINAGIIPIYSNKDSDILNYRKGLVHFYESGDYSLYADYFLRKHVERIENIEKMERKAGLRL